MYEIELEDWKQLKFLFLMSKNRNKLDKNPTEISKLAEDKTLLDWVKKLKPDIFFWKDLGETRKNA